MNKFISNLFHFFYRDHCYLKLFPLKLGYTMELISFYKAMNEVIEFIIYFWHLVIF